MLTGTPVPAGLFALLFNFFSDIFRGEDPEVMLLQLGLTRTQAVNIHQLSDGGTEPRTVQEWHAMLHSDNEAALVDGVTIPMASLRHLLMVVVVPISQVPSGAG